jgi:DNA-binding transcriptional LysR family regulator
MLDGVSLDQLRMLIAIADTGSFTAAAKRLQRAQSAVSHAIAGLETQLGLKLFDRSTKVPRLTAAGHAVIEDARVVIARVDKLKARARGLASGLEADLTLATSVVIPREALIATMTAFRDAFPTVSLRLFVEEVGGAPQLIADGTADLGFVGTPSLRATPADGIERVAIGFVDIVTVCAPTHPLAQHIGLVAETELLDHRQLVPTSRASPRYPNRMVQDVWEVADLGVRHDMLKAGLGWGTIPIYRVSGDLAAGTLVQIEIAARPDDAMRVPLFAIHQLTHPLGPAQLWLIDTMRTEITARQKSLAAVV